MSLVKFYFYWVNLALLRTTRTNDETHSTQEQHQPTDDGDEIVEKEEEIEETEEDANEQTLHEKEEIVVVEDESQHTGVVETPPYTEGGKVPEADTHHSSNLPDHNPTNSTNSEEQQRQQHQPPVSNAQMVANQKTQQSEETKQNAPASVRSLSSSLNNNTITNTPSTSGFLVSFIADARGGTTTSERAVGLKFIVPPNTLSGPTRLCCRVARLFRKSDHGMKSEIKLRDSNKANIQNGYGYSYQNGYMQQSSTYNSSISEKTTSSKSSRILVPEPATHEGSALACKTLELAPYNKTFLGPIGIEVPHCASMVKGNREVVAYLSDDGDSWQVYQPSTTIEQQFFDESNYEPNQQNSSHIFRVVTTKLPKYCCVGKVYLLDKK